MIDVIHDDDGKVIAYVEWSLRNQEGLEDKWGEFIFIHDIWVHEKSRWKGVIGVK